MSDPSKPEDVSAHAQTATGTGRAHDATVELRPAQLTPVQVDKAIAFLKERWGPTTPCPFHPTAPTRWIVDLNVGQIPGFSRTGGLSLSGMTFPVLVVTCQTCGLIVPINAIKAGVIEPDPPEGPAEAGDLPESEGK